MDNNKNENVCLDVIQNINPQNYQIVYETNGTIICEEQKILLYRKIDKQLMYVDERIVHKNFPNLLVNKTSVLETGRNSPAVELGFEEESNASFSSVPSSSESHPEDSAASRNAWCKNDILKLINLYSEHQEKFKSSTVKNDAVWKIIASQLKNHTSEQCKNKFKYLKSKYMEKKDNMSGRRTGDKNIKFEYFEQFDEIFNEDHNVNPLCTASSMKGEKNIQGLHVDDREEMSNPKRRKRSLLEKQLEKYEKSIEEREKAKQTRHEHLMERQDRALGIFQKIADSFEKFLDKN